MNTSMVLYSNGFGRDCVHQQHYHMVGGGQLEPHPNVSFAFWSDLIGNAATNYNMEMLFADYLVRRGPSMSRFQDVPTGREGEALWLDGMIRAAEHHGVEVQLCMAAPHQALASLQYPGITNARVNGDGGATAPGLRSWPISFGSSRHWAVVSSVPCGCGTKEMVNPV